ncbi:LOW QUALITY PROTEIN: putative neuroblastoma breakpoint family member 8 [Cinclus cinclus]|uniref:LOW QUALITY PROTEIN: putative neuroblastoma breakpoint family member 8 n=1 Tax=Cinclus cinclus TaxID=127875 RepID=UPI002E1626B8
MKENCRICGRELCGNQRRWIFHTAAKLNLQVLLSHVLGRELCRDGRSEFACSKCAFMLDRIYRFDTVIARIEALSIERLQKLLLEKDRLKFCIASMYRRNNDDSSTEDRAGEGTVDLSNLPDARYAALLQEDFAYSGFEYWMDQEEHGLEPHSCHGSEGAGSRPRRCRGCAALRVADADYEAICKVPRKVARSISCGLSSRWSASVGNEESSSVCDVAESTSSRVAVDGDSMEEGTPASSVESLDTTVEASPPQQKDEDADNKGVKGNGKCDDFSEDRMTPSSSLSGNRLELALNLIKTLDYKPLQSPRGSRLPIPVKSSLFPPKLSRDLADGSASSAFLNTDRKSFSRAPLSLPLEISELQELWDDLCDDYMPLRVQDFQDEHQQPAPGHTAAGEHVSDVRAAELQGKLQHFEAANKLLQEKLNELNFELKSVQETSQRQDRTIQSLNEALKSKESKTEELYHIIEGQNETMAKLRDMLHRNQLGQLQVSESPLSPQEQQMSPLDLQNRLFCTKLEVQRLKRAQHQKEHQLAEAKRAAQLLETTVHEEEQQKEATWKHNQELRAVVQQLQAELQDKAQQLQTLEWEKSCELQAQEQRVQRLTQQLARKEQLLQESRELLQCQQNLEKSPAAVNAMLEKLQQRVSDRDAALERAVDEKFCALEKKEQELQQLRLCMREHGSDLERLRSVLSSNEATIHSLESLLKAKTLELEQVSATCQNLRWLKEEIEAKSGSRQKEQEGIIQQLQTCLHDRNKEVEELTATLLCKLGPRQSEVAEELCLRLQHKERMLQDLLSDRNRQTTEHDAEIRELLQALSTKEQQSRVAAEKMAQALAERSCELQLLRQHMLGKEPVVTQSAGARPLKQDKQPIQEILQRACGATVIAGSPQEDSSCRTQGVTMSAAELEKDLVSAKEELELMVKKERESRRELTALQSVVATQEEELQVQASDIESLTRTIQMKEDLIKDLQMQLVDPEEIPAMERLTQEVLVLREKVAVAESQGQEATGNRRQQLLLMLEGLVAERNRLNEALQAERQLYGSLVKFHTHPDSAARDHALQVELEGVHELRRQLEEALGRSLECLSRLETQGAIGGQAAGTHTDASTNFTDSMKEEAARGLAAQQSNSRAPKEDGGTERSIAPERELRAEQELRELKTQLEEAGFSSVSHIRKAMLSLCLENAELKERMGEATSLLESGEQEEAGLGSPQVPESRRLQRKSRSSLGDAQGFPVERGTVPTKRPALEARSQHDMSKRPCPGSPAGGDGSHVESSVPGGGWPGLGAELRSQVAQGQRQCQELQDKLTASEATVRAQAEQLKKYHVLLREPQTQQLSKQVQVDFQDLGYETCGRSETEADREETTSPECEEPDVFSETSLGEELGSPCQPGMSRMGKTSQKTMALEDVEALHQHIQDLKAQLLNANKVIQSLQRRARSISVTSGYTSSAERPLPAPKALVSPAHSLTDEDEGWQSDGHGTLCPPALRAHRDLQSLVHRVALLEAQLPAAKHGATLPKELQSATWPGKYNSLIQAQARELSHLRQMLREGRGVSRSLAQHLQDALRSFEDLLRGTDIDYYLGQGFREQLAQGRQLAERLSDKLGIRDRQDGEDKTSHELLTQRLSRELKEKVIESLEVKLQERSESPGSSCPPSESSHSASSSSFTSEGLELCSDGDAASEYSQCHEEPAQHAGLHFDSLSNPVSAPLPALAPGLSPFLPAGPPPSVAPPLLGCCGNSVCSLAEAQQELQVLQRQLGESVTLPVAPAKPTVPLGPFGEGSKAPASFCPHGALQGLTEFPRATDSRALWDVPLPGQLLCRALPLGYPSGQKLTGADLLEEHLVEIRNLRQRLEESICTNDRLREQLERRLASTGKASGLSSDFYAQTPELGLQLGRENQALHEENRTLRLQRDHLSQELARAQETFLAACSRAREAEAELGQRRGKQRRLAEELSECQESVRQLRDERRSLQEDNNRLQHSVTLLQQQNEEQRLLLQTLRAELHVYESLSGPSAETRAGCFPSPPVRDVGTNSAAALLSPLPSGTSVVQRMDEPRGADVLARKSEALTGAHIVGRLDTYRALEQHVMQGKALARELMCLTRPALGTNCPLPGKEVKCGQDGAGSSWGPDPQHTVHYVVLEHRSSPEACRGSWRQGASTPGNAAGTALPCWTEHGKSPGAVGRGKTLLCPAAPAPRTLLPQALGWMGTGQGHLWGSASTLHSILEECVSLLTAFWSTVLPVSPAQHQGKEQVLQGEIAALRARLSEREDALQSAARRLRSTAQLKDSMEQFIVSQLTRTHSVLRKARTNLEVKAQQALPVA